MTPMHLLAILLPALLALAPPARAQPRPETHASLLARAPRLAITGPIRPLAAPLAIGGAGWAAFKRLCVTRHLIQTNGKEVPETEPSCFTVQAARADGDTWHLDLLSDPIRGGPRIAFATTRNAAGQVGPVTITLPPEMGTPPATMVARLQILLRTMIEAHGLPRTTIAPATGFVLPLALAAADPDMTVDGDGFACHPAGTATLRGRAVLVATCRTTARNELDPGQIARIDIAGRFAIDVATGMVLQYAYSSFLFMEADPKETLKNLRWRGISRQSLE